MDRRHFVLGLAAGLGVVSRSPGAVPITGAGHPGLKPFDDLMTGFLEENKVPGAALAVTRNGALVYARGFGYADREAKKLVEPTALFRIASVSKPITAVAVLQQVQGGKIKLDDPIMPLLKLTAPEGAKVDDRWNKVTVHQCLQHRGGWDRDKSFDPIGIPWKIAQTLKTTPPVPSNDVIRYMLGQPLDFDPGERYAYSNLGYLLLGRALETVTDQSYEAVVTERIWKVLGRKQPQLARALPENRPASEVRYYDSRGERLESCLYPPKFQQKVPVPDGAMNVEAFGAHGGWVASAVDLVKFASAFDRPQMSSLLAGPQIRTMYARPTGQDGDSFYACGWLVRPIRNTASNTWHDGLIPGTSAILVRRFDGLNWAVMFNTQADPKGKALSGLIDGKVHQAADAVTSWPDRDLFRSL